MKVALTMIQFSLRQVLAHVPSVRGRLCEIYGPSQILHVPQPWLVPLMVNVVEELLEKPVMGFIQRVGFENVELALLGTVNHHMLALPLQRTIIKPSHVNLARHHYIPRESVLTCDVVVATDVLVQDEYEMVVTASLEPRMLEPMEVTPLYHRHGTTDRQNWLLSWSRDQKPDKILEAPWDDEHEMVDLFIITWGLHRRTMPWSRLYVPIADIPSLIYVHHDASSHRLMIPLTFDGVSEPQTIVLHATFSDEDLHAWQ